MVKFYLNRVTKGFKKWNEVPSLWRDDVIAKLKEEGYTLNEDGTVSIEE